MKFFFPCVVVILCASIALAGATEEKDEKFLDDISNTVSSTVRNVQNDLNILNKKVYGAFENVEKWVQDLRNKLRSDLANLNKNTERTLGEVFGSKVIPMNGWEFRIPEKLHGYKYKDLVRMMGAIPPTRGSGNSFLATDSFQEKAASQDDNLNDSKDSLNLSTSDSDSSTLNSQDSELLVQEEEKEKDEEKWSLFGPSDSDIKKMEDDSKANAAQIKTLVAAGQIPDSFDFFKSFPICRGDTLNQGKCGSCWAFSSALSSSYRICKKMVESNWTKIPKGFLISPQSIVSCAPAIVSANVCSGGQTQFSLSWLSQQANPLHSCFGYDSWTGEPNRDECPKANKCAKFPAVNPYTNNVFQYVDNIAWSATDIPTKVKNIQAAILADGPVSVTVRLATTFMGYSGKGVYRASPADPLVEVGPGQHAYHAMTIFGWGVEDDGTKYWLVQNQWDELYHWGMPKGYGDCIKMLRGEDNSQIESILIAALTVTALPAQNPFGGSAGTSANNTPFPAPANTPAPAAPGAAPAGFAAGSANVRSRRSFLDISKDLSKLEKDVERLEH